MTPHNPASESMTAQVESLYEFHRGVETAYHRWSTGATDEAGFIVEVAILLIVLPEEA